MLCVCPPPVPVIVSVEAPEEFPVVIAKSDIAPFGPGVTGLGLNVAVTLVGNPLTLSVTGALNPPAEATLTGTVPLLFRRTNNHQGVERLNLPTPVTCKKTVVLCEELEVFVPVPVIVREYVPAGVSALVVILSVLSVPAVAGVNGFVLKVAVAPTGNPLTESVTGELYPLIALIETV